MLNPQVVVVVEQWLEMPDEFIQHDSCIHDGSLVMTQHFWAGIKNEKKNNVTVSVPFLAGPFGNRFKRSIEAKNFVFIFILSKALISIFPKKEENHVSPSLVPESRSGLFSIDCGFHINAVVTTSTISLMHRKERKRREQKKKHLQVFTFSFPA